MDKSGVGQLSLHFEVPSIGLPTLNQQVQQLIRERGALRHITEQSLEAELAQPVSKVKSIGDGKDDDSVESDDEKPQARQEKLWKSREEMLQKLAYAQNEILSALDFVSLLLSGKSAAAQSSMSPALKERVPVGSLEAHAVEKQAVSNSSAQRLSQVSGGWKSESFKVSSNKFSQAANRLEGEASRQTKYWDQIAGLKQEGWSISRLPADARAVGIHFGFPEAAPQFRNRGFALLQQNESGNVQLDSRSIPENHSMVQVVILRNGVQTGISCARSPTDHQSSDINEQVIHVRDAIFEEELFHEMNREARLIANQGVRTQPRSVEADIGSNTRIQFIQTDLDDGKASTLGGSDDQLAESVALNIRLLLLLEHQNSKERRRKPPATMTLIPTALPEYALLRPVLAQLRHQTSISALRASCESFSAVFRKAGLEFTFVFAEIRTNIDNIDVQLLRQPCRSLLTIRLGTDKEIEVEAETYLGSPIYGTVFRSKDLDFGFIHLYASSFSTIDEAVEYLAHVITLELMSQTSEFEVLKPHSGEVMLKASTERIRATISVRAQRLTVLVVNPVKVAFSWRSSGFQRIPEGETSAPKTFREVVDSLARRNGTVTSTLA